MANSFFIFIPGLHEIFGCKPLITPQGSIDYLSSQLASFAQIFSHEASQEKDKK